ncbi:MAG TPA: hypothetical protein VEX35_04035 [Allosphingosinicella sp.]|nr:hypothetical protein [Allosphingosinicella sp.]
MAGKCLYIAALTSLLAPSGITATQSQVRDACRADRTSDACVRARTEAARQPYEIPPLERLEAAGDRVRQVFYVDRAGEIMVSFIAQRGGSAVATVQYPRRRDGRIPPPLRALVPERVWREVLALSEPFNARPPPPDSRTICLDGGTYLIVAIDPGRSDRLGRTTRQTLGHDCERGPAPAYAYAIARLALPLFPACARIDARRFADPVRRLGACRLLRGDRMAAAEVLSRAQGFGMTGNAGDTARLAGLFSARSELHWDGTLQAGDPAVLWAARAAPSLGVTRLLIEAVEGISARRVRLTGRLTRPVDTRRGTATGPETAQVEQLWRRDRDGLFRVARATVGAWEPFAPPIND